jgi:hypothetical protein
MESVWLDVGGSTGGGSRWRELGREQCRKAADGTNMQMDARARAALARFLLLFIAAHRNREAKSHLPAQQNRLGVRSHAGTVAHCLRGAPSLLQRTHPLPPLPTQFSPNCCMSAVLAATEPRRDQPCSPTTQPTLLSRATCEPDIHTTTHAGLPEPVLDLSALGAARLACFAHRSGFCASELKMGLY